MKNNLINLILLVLMISSVTISCDKDDKVTGVELNQTEATLAKGEYFAVRANVLPETAANKKVTWTSSDTLVASVVDGYVTAVGEGVATIMVTTDDGNFTAKCYVTVLTPIEMLTTPRGWKIIGAESSPPYLLLSGDEITDLFDGYLFDCELDDIIYFKENEKQYLNPGDDQMTLNAIYECENSVEKYLGNWELSDDLNTLDFYLPYYPEIPLSATVLQLDRTRLRINVTVSVDHGSKGGRGAFADNGSKEIREYSFTLTYTSEIFYED